MKKCKSCYLRDPKPCKVYEVEDFKIGKYSAWDKLRYYLLTGEGMKK